MKQIVDSKFILQALLANNPDPVVVKDADLRVVIANSAYLNLYPEQIRDQVIGSTLSSWLTPAEVATIVERDKVALESGSSRLVESVTLPDGQIRVYDMHRVRFEDSDGAAFVLGTSRDVTERETLIDKLTHSNEELERFAFIASHDLQEPLRMVRNFTELLQSDYGDSLDDTARKFMGITIESATHMQELIDDLLIYSRLGEDGAKDEEVDVNAIVDYVESNLMETIAKSNARIIRNDLPCFMGNPVRFSRIVQNLLSNALKYQAEGNTPTISISAVDLENTWLFSIKDNGIGMENEYREQIFLPFKRLHGRSQFKGTGLGLAICRRIIESMGGLIWVESELNLGSSFSFTMPK